MKKYLILITVFGFLNSSALAEVASTSDSCATLSLDGPSSVPQTSYSIKASIKNNMGTGYSTLFFVDDQLKERKSDSANSSASVSFGPFEGAHAYKLIFENVSRVNYCKSSVELSIKNMDPKDLANAISSAISNLHDSAFKGNAAQLKKAFSSKIAEVVSLITFAEASTSDADKSKYYQQAIDKLKNDIAAKMDGSMGGQPNNDWITDPTSQTTIYQSVSDLISTLEGLK